MSRLTYRDENGEAFIVLDENSKEWCVSVNEPSYAHTIQCEAVDKLADYEDKQEQGLLIVLPVAEGTEVWCIGSCGELCDNWMECEDCKEHEIVFSTNFDRNMVEQWGKTVFATEAEAEEALAKMGE